MIVVTVNGESKKINAEEKLANVLDNWQTSDQPFAVAINQVFIPKSDYLNTELRHGDQIELLSPMQGG